MATVRADEVRDALRGEVARVLDWHGVQYRRRGSELRTRLCPSCGQRSRDSVCVEIAAGRYIDHAHGCKGDVFALIAGYAGLEVDRDFPRVVELAAEIAGLTATEPDPSRDRRLAERRRDQEQRERSEQAEREAVRARMPTLWNALGCRSDVGERYLAGRRLDPHALRACGDVVRFSSRGEPAVALRDLASGAIAGIQYRTIDGGDMKLRAERGSQLAGATLHGRVAELDREGADVAVIVEGLADTLAAILAWPGCAVFGAPGAPQLERVAAAVAPRVAACRGWLLVVPDVDGGAGERGAASAVAAAIRSGLVLDRTIWLVDVRPHHDLADAWAAGWRWEWPS